MNISINSRFIRPFAVFNDDPRQLKIQGYATVLNLALDRIQDGKCIYLSDDEQINLNNIAKESGLSAAIITGNNLLTEPVKNRIELLKLQRKKEILLKDLSTFPSTFNSYVDGEALIRSRTSLRRRYTNLRHQLLNAKLPVKDIRFELDRVSKMALDYLSANGSTHYTQSKSSEVDMTFLHEQRNFQLSAAMNRMRFHQNIRTPAGTRINLQSLAKEANVCVSIVYEHKHEYKKLLATYKTIEKERKLWVISNALNDLAKELPLYAERNLRKVTITTVLKRTDISFDQFRLIDIPMKVFYQDLARVQQEYHDLLLSIGR